MKAMPTRNRSRGRQGRAAQARRAQAKEAQLYRSVLEAPQAQEPDCQKLMKDLLSTSLDPSGSTPRIDPRRVRKRRRSFVQSTPTVPDDNMSRLVVMTTDTAKGSVPITPMDRKAPVPLRHQSAPVTGIQSPEPSGHAVRPGLALPDAALLLILKFSAVEQSLRMYTARRQYFVTLEDALRSACKICKRTVTRADLMLVHAQGDRFYSYRYTKITRKEGKRKTDESWETRISLRDHRDALSDKSSVGTRFCTVPLLKQRAALLKRRLEDVYVRAHDALLAERAIPGRARSMRRWHPSFRPSEVELPSKSLPEPPRSKEQSMLNAFLKGGKGTRLQRAEVQKKLASTISSEAEARGLGSDGMAAWLKGKSLLGLLSTSAAKVAPEPDARDVPKHLRHLDPKILAKIRGRSKKKAILKCTGATVVVREAKKRAEHLNYLVDLLRGIMITARRSAMPLPKLLKFVLKQHRERPKRDEAIKQMQLLSDISKVSGMDAQQDEKRYLEYVAEHGEAEASKKRGEWSCITKPMFIMKKGRKSHIFKVDLDVDVKWTLEKIKRFCNERGETIIAGIAG